MSSPRGASLTGLRAAAFAVVAVGLVGTGLAVAGDPPGSGEPPAGKPGSAETGFAEASNRFGVNLFHALRHRHRGNFAFSPASVSLALTMTQAGARGETAAEMARALQNEALGDGVHGSAQALLARWATQSGDGLDLRVANRLFGERSMAFHDPFIALTRERYGAPLSATDFVGDPDGARALINAWVAEETRDRIRDLLPDGSIDSLTRLVLTNAIYFKGRWLSPFDPKRTRPLSFQRDEADPVEVPTMYQKGLFGYARQDGVEVLELAFASAGTRAAGARPAASDLVMTVLLPSAETTLDAFEASLTAESLAAHLTAPRSTRLDVWLPRFRIEPGDPIHLKPALWALGMRRAFLPDQAELTGMAALREGEPRLYVKECFHKAFVEVNEEGAEAAAATAVVVGTKSIPLSFRANRPFLFVIRDRATGAVLFLGRVADPSQSS